MLDNQTRRELLSKARQSGFPGSILDVFTAYEQGKDLIGEFQQQQQQQQGQQMSDMAAQQAGMMAPGQQPLPQEMPQAPAGPPPGLQGQSLPSPEPPANPNLVDSTQQQPVGMATNAKGSSGGQVLMANGGFVEKFTDDQYNKFSSHFPFSKEQRGSIAHRATVEHPDLTMVNPKKYVFGGLKYALGGLEGDPKKKGNIATAADSSYVAAGANAPHNFYKSNGYDIGIVPNTSSGTFFNLGMNEAENNKWETGNAFDRLAIARKNYEKWGKSESNIDVVTNQPIPYNDYTTYKPGTHRFEQRELAIGAMNSKAPKSKYDDRIMPQRMAQYDNWKTGDSASVPVYDKLAVTPWGELSDKQKIKRLQQYGGSGTPYKDKASVKKAIQELKVPKPIEPPMENPKMIEAKPLPLPPVDLKPQLQNIPSISNPYPAKPKTEYFLMPSGNPGVGVIHSRTYDGAGSYSEKVIGPSLAKDWLNDEGQRNFDTKDMSSRINYDPRDTDQKVYSDMYDATQEVEKGRKNSKGPKIIKTPKFATGGYKVIKKRR